MMPPQAAGPLVSGKWSRKGRRCAEFLEMIEIDCETTIGRIDARIFMHLCRSGWIDCQPECSTGVTANPPRCGANKMATGAPVGPPSIDISFKWSLERRRLQESAPSTALITGAGKHGIGPASSETARRRRGIGAVTVPSPPLLSPKRRKRFWPTAGVRRTLYELCRRRRPAPIKTRPGDSGGPTREGFIAPRLAEICHQLPPPVKSCHYRVVRIRTTAPW